MEKDTYVWKIKLPSTMIYTDSVSFLTSTNDRIQKYSSMFGFPWTNPSVNAQWYIKKWMLWYGLKSIIITSACNWSEIFLVEKLSSRNGFFYANKRKLIHRAQNSATVNRKTPFWILWSLWLPSIIITITSNEPWNIGTHKTDGNPPITNQKPWPFEPVKVKFVS